MTVKNELIVNANQEDSKRQEITQKNVYIGNVKRKVEYSSKKNEENGVIKSFNRAVQQEKGKEKHILVFEELGIEECHSIYGDEEKIDANISMNQKSSRPHEPWPNLLIKTRFNNRKEDQKEESINHCLKDNHFRLAKAFTKALRISPELLARQRKSEHGSVPVYFPESPTKGYGNGIVIKDTRAAATKEEEAANRAKRVDFAVRICQENEFDKLVIPKCAVIDGFLVEENLDIQLPHGADQNYCYHTSREAVTPAVEQMVGLLFLTDFKDLVTSKEGINSRLDNAPFFLDKNGKVQIALVDLTQCFSLPNGVTAESIKASLKTALLLYPLHKKEIQFIALKHVKQLVIKEFEKEASEIRALELKNPEEYERLSTELLDRAQARFQDLELQVEQTCDKWEDTRQAQIEKFQITQENYEFLCNKGYDEKPGQAMCSSKQAQQMASLVAQHYRGRLQQVAWEATKTIIDSINNDIQNQVALRQEKEQTDHLSPAQLVRARTVTKNASAMNDILRNAFNNQKVEPFAEKEWNAFRSDVQDKIEKVLMTNGFAKRVDKNEWGDIQSVVA